MPMFLTYAEYAAMGGTIKESEFHAWERKASGYINLMTHNRIKDESPVRENVKYAAFDLIDLLVKESANTNNAETGLSSQRNDGVSVTYANWNTVNRYWKNRRKELLAAYLGDETVIIAGEMVPLLYGGVEYDGGDVP